MNMKDFSLMKEDQNSYTIGHPKGKAMTIPKRGLSDKAHQLIKKLKPVQHFETGGDVGPDLNLGGLQQPDNPNQPALGSQVAEAAPFLVPGSALPQTYGPPDSDATAGPVPASVDSTPGQIPHDEIPDAAPTAMDAATPPDTQPFSGRSSETPFIEEKAANKAQANAIAGQGEAESKAMQNAQDQIDQLPSQNDILAQYKAKDDALLQSYMNKKIDPNRVYSNMGTGNKISAGLGIILGGIGSARTGQPNAALELIKNAVNNDIAAQQNDQSKAASLWKMNQEAYGNATAASLATQNQIYTGLKYQLMSAASKFKGPVAQAQAQGLNALIDQKLNENRMKLSLFSPSSDLDPASRVGMMQKFGLITPEQAKGSLEEIKNNQDLNALAPKIEAAFQKGSSRNPNTAAQGQREFEALINTTVKETEGTARQAAFKSIHDTMTPSGPTAFPGEDEAKLRTVREYLASHAASPTSKSIGVDLTRYPSTRFAPAVAPEIQKRGGVQYQKVPGGWKKVQ